MDEFTQIAKEGIGGCSEFLYDPQPAEFQKKLCVLNRKSKPMDIRPKLHTKEELYQEQIMSG